MHYAVSHRNSYICIEKQSTPVLSLFSYHLMSLNAYFIFEFIFISHCGKKIIIRFSLAFVFDVSTDLWSRIYNLLHLQVEREREFEYSPLKFDVQINRKDLNFFKFSDDLAVLQL